MHPEEPRLWVAALILNPLDAALVLPSARPIAEEVMNAEYIISGIIALFLLGYLFLALLKPEKF